MRCAAFSSIVPPSSPEIPLVDHVQLLKQSFDAVLLIPPTLA